MLKNFISAVVKITEERFKDSVARCKPLAGYIETTEISAIHAETPGIYITSVGSGETTQVETGEIDSVIYMVAYLLVVNSDSLKRESSVQELITKMLTLVNGNRWQLPNVHPAREVESSDLHGLAKGFKPDVSSWRYGVSVLARASDLYGGTDPIANLALWAVTWEQMLRLGTHPDSSEAVNPNQIYSRFELDVEKVL